MDETQNPTAPPTERQRPGRLLASIVQVTTREHGFIFARLIDTAHDEEPEECFIHKTTVPADLWDILEPGHAITCKIQETSKGLRGWEIRAGSDDDQLRVDQLQEVISEAEDEEDDDDTRGNR